MFLDSADAGGRAVLLVADQRAHRVPVACAKTGEVTDRLAPARAVDLRRAARWELAVGATLTRVVALVARRPSLAVAIPLSERAWKGGRVRVLAGVVVTAAGVGAIFAGVISGRVGAIVLGVPITVLGWWLRLRATRMWWVGLTFRPDRGEILVTRVHESFAAQARLLFTRSVGR
jgi:hypothetical protein